MKHCPALGNTGIISVCYELCRSFVFKVIFICFVSVCILYCYTVFLQRKVTYTNIQYTHRSVCVSGDSHLTWCSCFNPTDSCWIRGTVTWFSPSASVFPCRLYFQQCSTHIHLPFGCLSIARLAAVFSETAFFHCRPMWQLFTNIFLTVIQL